MKENFVVLNENELEEVEGGIGLAAGIAIGAGVVLAASAAVSFFNGYVEAGRGE